MKRRQKANSICNCTCGFVYLHEYRGRAEGIDRVSSCSSLTISASRNCCRFQGHRDLGHAIHISHRGGSRGVDSFQVSRILILPIEFRSATRVSCAAAGVYGRPRVKGIGGVLRVGRGMQRSVSNRPSYLRFWHEFLSIQPKRSPRNPVSDPPHTFLVFVETCFQG